MLFGGIIERDRKGTGRKEDFLIRESDWIPVRHGRQGVIERCAYRGFPYIVMTSYSGRLDAFVRITDDVMDSEELDERLADLSSASMRSLFHSSWRGHGWRYVTFTCFPKMKDGIPQLDVKECSDGCRKVIDAICQYVKDRDTA